MVCAIPADCRCFTTYAEMSSRFCSFAPSIALSEIVESKVAKRPWFDSAKASK